MLRLMLHPSELTNMIAHLLFTLVYVVTDILMSVQPYILSPSPFNDFRRNIVSQKLSV
jgi:hypothetical protein